MKNNNKDIANSLNEYTDYTRKGINLALDSVDNINKWYVDHLNKITENDSDNSRLETGVQNITEITNNSESDEKQISTKVKQYNEIQTNKYNKNKIIKANNIQTASENKDKDELLENSENNTNGTVLEKNDRKLKTSERISTLIKGAKFVNNSAQKVIRIGKDISIGLNENGTNTFKETTSKIMTKPIKNVTNKVSRKISKETVKYTKKVTKKMGKISAKLGKQIVYKTTNLMIKLMKLLVKLIASAMKLIISMLPEMAPVLIIIVIIAALVGFFGINDIQDADNINFDDLSQLLIEINDEKIRVIYNEFLKNIGKPYLMNHSNLNYDECMDYYDCSSWVIHCLAHTGIITIPNTNAKGIYNGYCIPINVDDRKAGDLIFLKDTYDTGQPESISHIGIYMGTLTINGDTDEYVIDTGENPSGVRIRKYNNGWWNGPNFYGFGRLKDI